MKRTIIVIIVLVLGVLAIVFSFDTKKQEMPRACTEEARMCPGGSSVARTGPNCEFSECPKVIVGETIAKINEQIILDGLYITPKKLLEDSRCPANANCIWAGRVKLELLLTIGSQIGMREISSESPTIFADKKIELVNVLPQSIAGVEIPQSDYVFEFKVTDNVVNPPQGQGLLKGHMTLGPICPVEREGQVCKPSPEAYAARKIYIRTSDKKTLVTTLTPDAEGNYSATLNAGSYFVDMDHPGVGGTSDLPKTVIIEAGKTFILNLDVDTGIR